MSLQWRAPTNWAPARDPAFEHYAEEWSKTPTPIYDEFKVDFKKLSSGGKGEIDEAKRISDMWQSQIDKFKQKYPDFPASKITFPAADAGYAMPHAQWGPKLMQFQSLERWAASGFESAGHMKGVAEQKQRDLEAKRIQEARAAKEREIREARKEAERYSKVKTGDLLGLDEKKEEDLMKFPSRDEELKGLFGGRGKKSRKSKKARKTRRSTRRRV